MGGPGDVGYPVSGHCSPCSSGPKPDSHALLVFVTGIPWACIYSIDEEISNNQ